MNVSAPFIRRPIGTALLALGLALAGLVAYVALPIASLPQVDTPTIAVWAALPGSDPETTATSITAPLERHLGTIAGLQEMTSYSALGAAYLVLQFDLSRRVDDAGRDVQAAINAAGGDLPAGLPSPPAFWKFNPGSAPVLILAATSDTLSPGAVYDAVDSIVAPRIAQVLGVSQVQIRGSEQPAIRIGIDPAAARAAGISLESIRQAIADNNVARPRGLLDGRHQAAAITVNDGLASPEEFGRIILKQKNGAVVRLSALGQVAVDARDRLQAGSLNGSPAVLLMVFKRPEANVIDVVDGIGGLLPQLGRWLPAGSCAMRATGLAARVCASAGWQAGGRAVC